MIRFYLFILVFTLRTLINGQTINEVSHYSVDDGLSENHVLCMLQDRKGMMWFGTFDGLSKFDGYTFRSFKGYADQQYQLVNFRIDKLEEDMHGYLWLQTNDGRIYRFDSTTETFLPVPQCIDEYKDYKNPLTRIYILADGTVWLKNSDPGNEDCFRVENIEGDKKIKLTQINNEILSSNKINKIYLDNNQNTWFLTTNGIDILKKGKSQPGQLLKDDQRGNFVSVCENETSIYFGGENGILSVFNKISGSHDAIKTPFEANLIDIHQLNANELLLLTNTADLYLYHISTKQFQPFRLNNLKSNKVFGSYKDKNNNVWIDADYSGGIFFDSKTKTTINLPVEPSKLIYSSTLKFYVLEDGFNNIWVQLRDGGFYKYNKEFKRLEQIQGGDSDAKNLSNITHTAISDNQGNLWLSTYLQGVDKLVFKQSPFIFTKPIDTNIYIANNEIRSIFQDSKNWLWVGSKKGLVYLYDDKKELMGTLGSDGVINSQIPFNSAVYDIIEDHDGAIWLASKGKGLFKLIRKPNNTFSITNYQHDPNNNYSISSNSVYSIFEDHQHRIWAGTFHGGLNLLDTCTGQIRFINHHNELKNYPINDCSKIRYITQDEYGNLFVATTQGLLVCKAEKQTPEEIVFKRYVHYPDDENSLSGNDIQYILPSQSGDVYLALIGGGINVVKGGFKVDKEPIFEKLNNIEGTSLNVIYSLKEDMNGYIWMSAQTQIVKYDPHNSKFDVYKPTSPNNYYFDESAACQTRQGEIIYGTSHGFVSFNPLKITKSSYVPTISLTQLQIFNKPVVIGDEGSPLKMTIDNTRELTLSHDQNIFSIEYAALDFTNPQTIKYAYKLDGLENDWNYVGTQRIANYINLPKGEYTFRVKSTNADGVWVSNEKTITIIKLPSFWESNWGLAFYVVAFLLLSALSAFILFTIYRLRNELDIEQRITNLKLRFFTDISHELRTPLTLITSPVENLLNKEPLSANAREQLIVVQRNTNRMLRLINQILDFRKIQNKKMKLIIESVNVADFINDICKSFKKAAEDKNINLKITDNTGNTQLWVDKDKFEKIIFNLLSNAFKFTNNNKEIEVIISDDPENVIVTIRDEGAGISKDRLSLLFNRFESFATSKATFQNSTGIGLSLAKELVEMHQATIDVESEAGKGSNFKVTFKKGFDHFGKDNEFLLRDANQIDIESDPFQSIDIDETIHVLGEADSPPSTEHPKILIVEDNHELRAFLKSALRESYEVHEADNGLMALNMATSIFPDIIISDVMMPDMDGLELARTLKGDIHLCHIPLILLTAKTDMESKLEAMECGVDDYITKPFSLTYLQARVDNLLKIRSQLQDYFRSSLTTGVITLSKPSVTNLDEIFINKTMKFMEENHENSEMTIDDIAMSTGMSRSSFFKKIKSLTGLAPVDFVREYRLQKATQLIEAGETNVGQIAYNVGINDPRYFSKCFKQKYGVTPSEYMAKNR